jgi:hypothetical protein
MQRKREYLRGSAFASVETSATAPVDDTTGGAE